MGVWAERVGVTAVLCRARWKRAAAAHEAAQGELREMEAAWKAERLALATESEQRAVTAEEKAESLVAQLASVEEEAKERASHGGQTAEDAAAERAQWQATGAFPYNR